MQDLIAHPIALTVIALACIPTLFPLARFFFGDLEELKAEAGLTSSLDVLLWAIGQPRQSVQLQFKVAGFIGSYGILVFLLYLTACQILG